MSNGTVVGPVLGPIRTIYSIDRLTPQHHVFVCVRVGACVCGRLSLSLFLSLSLSFSLSLSLTHTRTHTHTHTRAHTTHIHTPGQTSRCSFKCTVTKSRFGWVGLESKQTLGRGFVGKAKSETNTYACACNERCAVALDPLCLNQQQQYHSPIGCRRRVRLNRLCRLRLHRLRG